LERAGGLNGQLGGYFGLGAGDEYARANLQLQVAKWRPASDVLQGHTLSPPGNRRSQTGEARGVTVGGVCVDQCAQATWRDIPDVGRQQLGIKPRIGNPCAGQASGRLVQGLAQTHLA
jgi:hypothetical protein